MDFDPDKIAGSPFVIGGVGAFIASFKFIPGATFLAKIFNGVSGTAVAGFVAPALTEWLHMATPAYQGAAAFLLGMFGMSLAAAVMQAIKDTPLGQIITGWLSRRGS